MKTFGVPGNYRENSSYSGGVGFRGEQDGHLKDEVGEVGESWTMENFKSHLMDYILNLMSSREPLKRYAT